MQYEKITPEQRQAMWDQRLTQFENEHYQHAMNLAKLDASGDTDEATEAKKKEARDAMADLDAAHAKAKAEITKIKAEPKPATPK